MQKITLSPPEINLLYQKNMFIALREFCLAVTGRVHAFVYPSFFEKYPLLARHAKDFDGHRYAIINLSDHAVESLAFVDKGISFTARFAGEPVQMYLPFDDILGLTNCIDRQIHRLSVACLTTHAHGYDPTTLVMMDYTIDPPITVVTPDPEPPQVKRPALSIVK